LDDAGGIIGEASGRGDFGVFIDPATEEASTMWPWPDMAQLGMK